MNIILLIIDTLRYDHVGANGNDRIRTPNLDALAERAWVFDRAFSGSFPTIPHRTDVMRGKYGRPFHQWAPLRHEAQTVPAVLADKGYCTQLIHDTPHLVNGGTNFDWPFNAWTFIRGAEVDRPWIDDNPITYPDNWARDPLFDYVGDPTPASDHWHLLMTYTRANRRRRREQDWNAAKLFLTAADWLGENAGRDNFFLWLDCFDPHEPWDVPPQYVRMYDDTPGYDGRIDPRAFLDAARDGQEHPLPQAVINRQRAMYAAKVTWVDRWVGELTAALAQTHLDERTAVIVTADHGTYLGERGWFGKGGPIHAEAAHVPLIVHAPGRGAGRCGRFAQPQDIAATILSIAGAQPPEPIDGHDLLDAADPAKPWPRQVALTGHAPCHWTGADDQWLFTIFAADAYLQWTPRPQDSRLFRYGRPDAVEHPDPAAVEAMWTVGLEEAIRRGTHPDLAAWLQGRGRDEFPKAACPSRAPQGYRHYWKNIYKGS